MIRSVSVYFWYMLSKASNSQGIQEQSALHLLPTKLFPLSLCPSIFLYHFVTYIFKLSTVSVTLRQIYAYILSVVLYFWRHTPPHISVRQTFIRLFDQTHVQQMYFFIFLGLLKKVVLPCISLTGKPANSGPTARITEMTRQTEPYYVNKHGRNTRAHPHARKTD